MSLFRFLKFRSYDSAIDLMTANTVFFFKQKTAYEMRISDWSSDVCSSDLPGNFSEAELIAMIPSLFASVGDYNPYAGIGSRETPADTCEEMAQIGRASCRERVCQYV